MGRALLSSYFAIFMSLTSSHWVTCTYILYCSAFQLIFSQLEYHPFLPYSFVSTSCYNKSKTKKVGFFLTPFSSIYFKEWYLKVGKSARVFLFFPILCSCNGLEFSVNSYFNWILFRRNYQGRRTSRQYPLSFLAH